MGDFVLLSIWLGSVGLPWLYCGGESMLSSPSALEEVGVADTYLHFSSSLSTLLLFVFHPAIRGGAHTSASSAIKQRLILLGWFACGAIFWFTIFSLFEAPSPLNAATRVEVGRTWLFSICASNLTWITISFEYDEWKRIGEILAVIGSIGKQTPAQFTWQTDKDRRVVGSVCGALLGFWLGAIPIPLDWDAPWQVWPNSLYISSLLCWTLGRLLVPLASKL